MSIKSAPYYWVECDGCGERCEYDEFTAMANEGSAIDMALDAEWSTDGSEHHCTECPVLAQCERCRKPAGENAADRDDHCEPCWALVNTAPEVPA
jgi:hypothetical protein